MTDSEIEARVADIARPLAVAEGVELLEVRFAREGSAGALRLVIERSGSPTSVADCETLSRALEGALDAHNFIEDRYTLEVSSAGLTRPLRTLPDFTRNIGNLVRVVLRQGGDLTGTLREAGEEGLAVELEDGRTRKFALADVASARREIELFSGRNAHKGGRRP
jgi:ribosome maturation factor RimP